MSGKRFLIAFWLFAAIFTPGCSSVLVAQAPGPPESEPEAQESDDGHGMNGGPGTAPGGQAAGDGEACFQSIVSQAHAVVVELGPFCGRLPDRWRERCLAR